MGEVWEAVMLLQARKSSAFAEEVREAHERGEDARIQASGDEVRPAFVGLDLDPDEIMKAAYDCLGSVFEAARRGAFGNDISVPIRTVAADLFVAGVIFEKKRQGVL